MSSVNGTIGVNMQDRGAKADGGAVHTKKKDDPARVHEAAQQFESFMIGQMLKSMRENEDGGFGTGGDAAGASALSLGDEAFAKALGQSGGFGLARMVESGLGQSASKHSGPQKLKE